MGGWWREREDKNYRVKAAVSARLGRLLSFPRLASVTVTRGAFAVRSALGCREANRCRHYVPSRGSWAAPAGDLIATISKKKKNYRVKAMLYLEA